MQIKGNNFNLSNSFCNDCGWGDELRQSQVIKDLENVMKLSKNNPITFFWNANCGLETDWGIFVKYWTDFCYSSDDSNILVPHNSEKAIIYIEDKLWVVNRKDCFGRN